MSRQLGLTSRERGFAESERGYTRDLLEARFGKLSEAASARLDALPVGKLRELGRGAIQGRSLAELGLEDPPFAAP